MVLPESVRQISEIVLRTAVVYFFIVRPFASFAAKLAAAPAPPPADVVLLGEIRDLLKSKK